MREYRQVLRNHYIEAYNFINDFLGSDLYLDQVADACEIMSEAIKKGGKIISAGNGGSMCDAMHFAEELTGRWRKNRVGLPAIAISDPSYITCAANDFGYEKIFSRFLEGVGNDGDIFFGISTSGNSENIIEGIKYSDSMGIKSVILTGNSGGKIADMEFNGCVINTPKSKYADRVQEMHIKIIHSMIDVLERDLLRDETK